MMMMVMVMMIVMIIDDHDDDDDIADDDGEDDDDDDDDDDDVGGDDGDGDDFFLFKYMLAMPRLARSRLGAVTFVAAGVLAELPSSKIEFSIRDNPPLPDFQEVLQVRLKVAHLLQLLAAAWSHVVYRYQSKN